MKTTIATALAFLMAIGLYAYGTTSSAPIDPAPSIDNQPSTSAQSDVDERCPRLFLRGVPPTIPEAQRNGGIAICRTAYSSFNSPVTRTPIWSAEELNPQGMRAAAQIERDSSFEEELQLPQTYRAKLEDYRGSGWDRGHLAPSADMPSPDAQQESFSLANIIPHAPGLNRGAWADLESDIRSLARRRDSIHVVTGMLLTEPKVSTLPGGRVIIPDHVWKAVVSPGEGAVVHIARNRDGSNITSITLDDFRRSTGIDPFPAATQQESSTMLRMR